MEEKGLIRLIMRWILGTLAALVLAVPSSLTSAESAEPSEEWLAQATQRVRQQEYFFAESEEGHLSAPNRGHDLRTTVDPDGFEVVSRTEGPSGFRVRLVFSRMGRGDELFEVSPARVDGADGRVDLVRDDVVEWLINDDRGLEHGFTLDVPPPGRDEPVVFELDLEGSLVAYPLGRDALGVSLKSAAGKEVLRYDGLVVLDALGEDVPAEMEAFPGGIRIVVDDGDAVYPLTVDPVLTSPEWSVTGGLFWGYGAAVSTAGDVNGDGYSDVIIGIPTYDGGSTDEGLAMVYLGASGGPSTTASWSFQPNLAGARFGEAVSTAGDVNDDGYHEVIVGAPGVTFGHVGEGRAYVFLGSSTGLATSAAWFAESNQTGAAFGSAVDCAGDVNGDGYHDVVVAAPLFDNSITDSGKISVFFGSSSGLSSTPDFEQTSLHSPGSHFGASVAGAGDVNGDGYSDIVAGAPLYDFPEVDEGRVFIYLGSATVPAYGGAVEPGSGSTAKIHFGTSVSAAGDVNGDGYADIVIGAPDDWNSAGGASSSPGGSFRIYYGRSSGITSSASFVEFGPGTTHARYGASVATAGDVNGDGLADIVVGAPVTEKAYVYCGTKTQGVVDGCGSLALGPDGSNFGATVGTAGDVDGDGFSDVIVGAPSFAINSFVYGRALIYRGSVDALGSATSVSLFGDALGELGTSLAHAGDVNGDGFSDVIVGEPLFDGGHTDAGRVLVFHGGVDGLSTTPARELEGNQNGMLFGSSVDCAGDVNGDGYDDVIVGAPGWKSGQTDEGRALVYHGTATGVEPVSSWSIEANQTNARYGQTVARAGDVNGDGYADVLVGSPGFDFGQVDEGGVSVFHGGPGGLATVASNFLDPDIPGAEAGRGAATAGDVNGDGYSDVIVGAPGADRVYLYLGGVLGLIEPAAWSATGETTGESFGWAVSSAGDLDGDGLSEIIVGSPDFSNGQNLEGRITLFSGSWTGEPTLLATRESDAANTLLGRSVGNVGDVNADGYSDVIAGAPGRFTGSGWQQGAVRIWLGGPSGIPQSPAWLMTAGFFGSDALFGSSVDTAGDVNGDGFTDFIIGIPHSDPQVNDGDGAMLTFLGAGGGGMDYVPRQQQPFGVSDPPVAHLGRSNSQTSVRLRSRARTAAGRDRVRVEYEIKSFGVDLDGTNTTVSNSELLTSSPGSDGSRVNYSTRIYGLSGGAHYHWRLRFLSPNPRFPHTRWLLPPAVVPSQKAFMTACTAATWYRDVDGDGYGNSADLVQVCSQPPGYVNAGADCNDADPLVHPGAGETACDGIDNDCSGATPDAIDVDADGYDLCLAGTPGDTDGLEPDCNDQNPDVWTLPGETGTLFVDRSGNTALLSWSMPAQPGGNPEDIFFYKALRSKAASDYVNYGCMSEELDPETTDGDLPEVSVAFYYLIAAENDCGRGSLGQTSWGAERLALACP